MIHRLLIGIGIIIGLVFSFITKSDSGWYFFSGWLIGFLSWLLTLSKETLENGKIPCAICDGSMSSEQYKKFMKIVHKNGQN